MKKIILIWFTKNWIHTLAWIIFIFYETIVVGLIFGIYGSPITYILHYTINICFFYVNALVSFPWAMSKQNKNLLRLPLVLALGIASFILLNFIVDYLLVYTRIIIHLKYLTLNRQYTLKILYRGIYFLGFSTAYYFLLNFLQEKNKASKLERLRLEEIIKAERMATALSNAQNSFLKAQINPHFLFNTLDYIYHNIYSNADDASNAIILLSQIMRYAIDATHEDGFVSLGDEVEQVKTLLCLYQLRKANKLHFDLLIADDAKAIRFIPLVLLTLIENIIKHGNLNRPGESAIMSICVENNILNIYTDNLANNSRNTNGTNKGIKNIVDRLKHAFGNSIIVEYKITIQNHFIVNIEIPISQINLYKIVDSDINSKKVSADRF